MGRSKNHEFKYSLYGSVSVSVAFRLFLCHFVKFHQSRSPLCSFFNLQKHIRKKNKIQLDVFFRTPKKGNDAGTSAIICWHDGIMHAVIPELGHNNLI